MEEKIKKILFGDEGAKEARVRVKASRSVWVIGPNNWEIIPCDEQGNLLPSSKLGELGYQIIYVYPPSLLRASKDIEKVKEDSDRIRLDWLITILYCINTAKSRGIGKDIIFAISDKQIDEFKLAWNSVLEYTSKEPTNGYEVSIYVLGMLVKEAIKDSKVYYVVGTNKNGGDKYYLTDCVLLADNDNLVKIS